MAAATEQEVRATVTQFLAAFENGDVEAMQAAFADDALTFPRTIMAKRIPFPIKLADYRRVAGMDPQMRDIIDTAKSEGRSPPYLRLEPEDLEIQLYGDVAVVTFHLTGERLGRRTLVLVKKRDDWRIVHLHASNVVAEGLG